MNRRRVLYLLPILALGISGCSRRAHTATVVLIDPSGSVTAHARKEEFAAVGALIPKMQRGDTLIVVPITDDAAADIQGRVLRLEAPARREAYDADLRRFRADAESEYTVFTANLLGHPGGRTDILGALDVARQEFEHIPISDRRRLIVLSDFIEDDGQHRFTTDPAFANPNRATRLAEKLRKQQGFALQNVSAYLGALESNDFARLSAERRMAVQTFWSEYFARVGKAEEIQSDGTGMLAAPGWN